MRFDQLKVGHVYKGLYTALITTHLHPETKFMWMFDNDWSFTEEPGYIDKASWDYEEAQEGHDSDLKEEILGELLIKAIFEKQGMAKLWHKTILSDTEGSVIIT